MAVVNQTGKKPLGATLPAVELRLFHSSCTVDAERPAHGLGEVLVEGTDRLVPAVHPTTVQPDNVDRPGDGISRDRETAGERLDIDQPERVRPTWKHEHVRRRVGRGELRALFGAEEDHAWIGRLELVERGSTTHHDLRSRNLEIKERGDVLLGRDPANIQRIGRGRS